MAYPDGTLLRASDQPQVWLVQGGERHWIPNPQVFNDDGFNWGAVLVVDDAQVDSIPQGADVPEYTTWMSPGPSDPSLPGQQLPVVEYGGVDYRRWRSANAGHTIYVRGEFVTQTGAITGSTITTNSVMFAGFHSATYAVITDGSGTIVWTSPAWRVGVNPQGFSGQTVVVPSTWNFQVPMDVADKAAGFALIVSDSPDNLQQILSKSVGGLITQVIQAIQAIAGASGGSKKSGSGQTANVVHVAKATHAHTTTSAATQRRGWSDAPRTDESEREPEHAMA